VQARKLQLHARDKSSVQDHFRTAIDALHISNMVDHIAETTCEKAY
jgi:hypothetical protein